MNCFACNQDPVQSAIWLANRHVVKMTCESGQVLSTVVRGRHGDALADELGLYKSSHRKHPVTLATYTDKKYRAWFGAHALALAREYTHRYGKVHKSQAVIERCLDVLMCQWGGDMPDVFPLAMPDEYKRPDPHLSYRLYLTGKYQTWARPPKWKNRETPGWYLTSVG